MTLSVAEAQELLESLQVWAEEVAECWAEEVAQCRLDPGWHTHLTDSDGNELTIAVTPEGTTGRTTASL